MIISSKIHKILRYGWIQGWNAPLPGAFYCLRREAVIKGEVAAIKYKPSPLVQGGLEIPIVVTVKWDDKNAIDILRKKVEEVNYPLGEDDRFTDELKDILNLILNDDASTDSD